MQSEITADQLDDEDEEKADEIVAETVKKEDANKAFETLRLFLLQNKQDCGNLIQKLDGFQDAFEQFTEKPKVQTKINDFLFK